MGSLHPIIPPYLLKQISESTKFSATVQNGAYSTLRQMAALRAIRQGMFTRRRLEAAELSAPHGAAESLAPPGPPAATTTRPHRTIYDCQSQPGLPFEEDGDGVFDSVTGFPDFNGTLLLTEGHTFTGSEDAKASLLYANLEKVYNFYRDVFGRDSVDGHGLKLVGCIHYDDDTIPGFFNAYWFRKLLVFGDGDGEVFESFGEFLDLTAHEFTHGVVETTANLEYHNQAGALDESLADVFASMVKQWSMDPKQQAHEADWLIAKGLFRFAGARALRDMANPGTAYDGTGTDGVLMIDPQPRDMDNYKEFFPPNDDPDTGNDGGGVHIYSGIPNRAFYLVATTLGGHSWDVAGKIWYDAMRDVALQGVDPRAAFRPFADLTVKHADRHGHSAVDAVKNAWKVVKVFP